MIQAKIVAGSKNPFNDKKLVTFQLRYPRIIHAEVMTHAMLVKNSSSSRAIPFSKKVEAVSNDPFWPIAIQRDHKGMQGTQYITDDEALSDIKYNWDQHLRDSISTATHLNTLGVTKQLCNRLLEPFEYIDVVISGTEWENFFDLRCPKYMADGKQYRSRKDAISNSPEGYDKVTYLEWLQSNDSQAEIHIQALAELMWDEFQSFDFKTLNPGEWHLPFYDDINSKYWDNLPPSENENTDKLFAKIATAICARGSYGKFEGKTVEDDIKLHDRLLTERHMSPFSHSAKCPTHDEYEKYSDTKYVGQDKPRELGWFSQFHGFMSYRYQLERGLI